MRNNILYFIDTLNLLNQGKILKSGRFYYKMIRGNIKFCPDIVHPDWLPTCTFYMSDEVKHFVYEEVFQLVEFSELDPVWIKETIGIPTCPKCGKTVELITNINRIISYRCLNQLCDYIRK